jgi:hypothetical protein
MQTVNLEQVVELSKTAAWSEQDNKPQNQNLNLIERPAEQSNGGALKLDEAKPNLALLPPEALLEIAKVLDFGAKKYSADNWRGGFKYRRVTSAMLRHLFAWLSGEDKDPESGLSHMAHVGCNVLFLLTFIVTKTGTDDRFTYGK